MPEEKALPEKQWRYFNDQCKHCGDDAEVLTDTGEDNLACDGDQTRCAGCGCPGSVTVEEEGTACTDWHDEAGCACAWCLANPA